MNQRFPGLILILLSLTFTTKTVRANDPLVQLLQKRQCPQCQLADTNLVHSDLRDADLRNAKLMRANLSQALLDGADLRGADLSFTSMRGASLRGADLEGCKLYGTDFREADLSGARLSQQALDEAHWIGAKGVSQGSRSHPALHNAGVEAFQTGRWPEAEQLFSNAIRQRPDEPLSWVARGISRKEQAKDELSSSDFRYAATLYEEQGNHEWAEQLEKAANAVIERRSKDKPSKTGAGMGIKLLEGAITGLRMIAPIASKALIPIGLNFQ